MVETEADVRQQQQHLSPRQLSALKAVIDALLPPLVPPENELPQVDDHQRREVLCAFWGHELSSDPHFLQGIETSILHKIPAADRFLLQWLLSALSTCVGTALVFGSVKHMIQLQAFSDMSTEEKTACMKSLQMSQFQDKRKIFNGLKRIICGLAFSFVPEGDKRVNPFWAAMEYPGPYHWKLPPEEDARRIKEGGLPDFRSMENVLLSVTEDKELEVDVVVVGSGCGGGVCAATLASQGYSVLVVEKGLYMAPHELTQLEADSFDRMYESHCTLTTSDGNMVMLAASTLGGGSTINWSCCLPLPDNVREEWVKTYKLDQFHKDGEFDVSQLAVMQRIGCTDKSSVQLNTMNRMMKDGCEAMSYKWEKTAQNIKDTGKEENGFICFGDRYGNKQSGLMTFLHDAVKSGAQIIENCMVNQIIHGYYTAVNGMRRRKACGIVGYVGEHKITVRARRCVVVAAGSLHTPCLLQKSWFTNPHIGKHLHLHPVAVVAGFFDKNIDYYLGSPMTGVCGEFEDGPDRDGYGARLECPSVHTGLAGAVLPFIDPVDFKRIMVNSKKTLPMIVLQRDSSEGRVLMGGDDCTPKVDYVLNKKDRLSILCALKGAVKVVIGCGARRVLTGHSRDPGFTVPPLSDAKRDEKIREYLDQIDERGVKEHEMGVFNAHQMGSCRMSVSPDTGVVDTNAEMWECDDLYVFDTSNFPTASGANPMLTVLTLSHMLSTRLAKRLLHEDGRLVTNPELSKAMDELRICRLKVSQYVPWTRGEKLMFAIAWSAVSLVMAWLFWNPGMPLFERQGGGEL